MKPFFCVLILFLLIGWSSSQAQDPPFRVAFYNLENLFDTLDNPGKNDWEYQPSSAKKWDTQKYQDKLNKISRVILALGDWQGPEVIGLCEVEDRLVLEDLLSMTTLANFDYEIVHYESPDKRGIDVALLFKRSAFRVYYERPIQVSLRGIGQSKETRDILHVAGRPVGSDDTLHVFVNHWPSRYGGEAKSVPKRIRAAETLKQAVDSLRRLSPNPNIVVVGDLNDATDDLSLTDGLQASHDLAKVGSSLFNTSYKLQHELQQGTHKYRAEWNLFDQVLISSALIQGESGFRWTGTSEIFKPEWLMEDDDQSFGKRPWRTWRGNNYSGGYSDHLPVFIDLLTTKI